MWNSEPLREQLERQGRTRKWLAEKCGITLGSLNQVFKGRKPSRPVLKLMALNLACSEAYLDPQPATSSANPRPIAVGAQGSSA